MRMSLEEVFLQVTTDETPQEVLAPPPEADFVAEGRHQ
jgi:hypothetical protein